MQRLLPLIAAVVLALVAFVGAFGINSGIRYAIAPEPGEVRDGIAVADAGRAAAPTPRVLSEHTYIDGILKRNLFDADFIESYNPAPRTGGRSTSGSGTRTDLKLKLLGTVVADPASFSSALISEDNRDGIAQGYGIGDKIMDAEVTAIAKKMVTLRRSDGTIEYLDMDGETRKEATASTEEGETSEEEGIEKLGENKYAVDRALLDKYIGDLESISRMGRALLHRGPDGEFDGYRLSAIRRNTLADKLGIRNGDVIHSVNGQNLNSVQGAMNAYNNMLNDSAFSFDVTRRGEKVQLDYEVR